MYKRILKKLLLDHFIINDPMHPACDIKYCYYETDGLWKNNPEFAKKLKKLYIQFLKEDENVQ